MKKLWITSVSLSIFVFGGRVAYLVGQEGLVQNRGAGFCWRSVRDAKGFELFEFIPSTNRCGWFVAYQIPRDTAGSNRGWPSGLYVKIVNANDPSQDFYLGGGFAPENQRQLKFGKGAKMACYVCQPKVTGMTGNLPPNCAPNDGDPVRRAACFSGYDALDCSRQVDCSLVVDIPECYQDSQGVIAMSLYNDLKLCHEADMSLANYGVGKDSEMSGKTQAAVQVGTPYGARGGSENIAPESGRVVAQPLTARVMPAA